MARGALSAQEILVTGLAGTYTDADDTNNHYFYNNGRCFVHVKNTSSASGDITFDTPGVVDGDLAVGQRTVSMTESAETFIGPFEPGIYNQTDGKVNVDVAISTSVSLAVFRI